MTANQASSSSSSSSTLPAGEPLRNATTDVIEDTGNDGMEKDGHDHRGGRSNDNKWVFASLDDITLTVLILHPVQYTRGGTRVSRTSEVRYHSFLPLKNFMQAFVH